MIFKNLFHRKPKRIQTRLDVLIDNISTIDHNDFKYVYSSDKSIITIASYYDRLIKYCDLLERLDTALLEDRPIYRIELPESVTVYSISDLFLDLHGNYSDPLIIIDRFLVAVEALLRTYKNIEEKGDKTFNNTKNLQTIQDVLNNIMNVIEIFNTIAI